MDELCNSKEFFDLAFQQEAELSVIKCSLPGDLELL